jgi:hypothetical protein
MAFWRLDLSCTEANEPDPAGQRAAALTRWEERLRAIVGAAENVTEAHRPVDVAE